MSRILAIDYGRKRVGLAVTDETRLAISKLPQLDFQSPIFWDTLANIIREYAPGLIILGNPIYHPAIVREVGDMQRHLQKRFDVPILLVDETGTSMEAEMVFHQLKPKSKKISSKKNTLDSIAATMLLKRYLNENS